MAHKLINFEKEARATLLEGVETLAKAVTSTLSPKGRNVAIQRQWGDPIVVHDGVTVSREVATPKQIYKDPLVSMGIRLVQQAAKKTNDEAGDGTTTATLLAYEIVKRGFKLIDEGMNPMVLRDQIDRKLPDILERLKEISKPVKKKTQIAEVAMISAADKEIGRLVAEAVKKVGKDGLVTVEEGQTLDTKVEYTEGLEIDQGYMSPYFITSEERMEAVIKEPAICLINRKISVISEIVPMLEELVKQGKKDIVIICKEMSGDALATTVHNKMKGNINILVVKAPTTRQGGELMDDISVFVGGKVVDEKSGINPQDIKEWVGSAEKVIANRNTTVIIEGKGDKKALNERIKGLRNLKETEKNQFQIELMEQRLAKLSTGLGIIKVGAKTEIDMRERVERVKDAIGAATSAREEGIVPGGGIAFLKLRNGFKPQNEGERLFYDLLESPIRKIMQNSGESGNRINEVIREVEKDESNRGYNVYTSKLEDMVEGGIIDPTKVLRLAIQNAVGVGTSILTTDCLIAYELDENDEKGGR